MITEVEPTDKLGVKLTRGDGTVIELTNSEVCMAADVVRRAVEKATPPSIPDPPVDPLRMHLDACEMCKLNQQLAGPNGKALLCDTGQRIAHYLHGKTCEECGCRFNGECSPE